MTAPKLKAALRQRGLSTQGLKGELKARLLKALQTTTSQGLVTQADKPKPVEKEEPDLLKRFGASYEAYGATVPRWLPTLSPWHPDKDA